MKINLNKALGFALASLIVLPAASWAQGMGQQGSGSGMGSGMGSNKQAPPTTGQQGTQTAPPAAAPAVDPKEEAAFKAWIVATNKSTDPKSVAQAGEDFIKKYPNYHSVDLVYGQLANAYKQLNDPDKAEADALRAIEKNPNSPDGLCVFSVVISRRYNPGDPNATQKFADVEKYSRHGIDVLTTMTKPQDQADADFGKIRDAKLSLCYSGLGLVEYKEEKSADAAIQFAEAIKREDPPDSVDQYLLGMSLVDTKQYSGAVSAFQDCLKDPGQMQKACADQLADAKKKAGSQFTPPKL